MQVWPAGRSQPPTGFFPYPGLLAMPAARVPRTYKGQEHRLAGHMASGSHSGFSSQRWQSRVCAGCLLRSVCGTAACARSGKRQRCTEVGLGCRPVVALANPMEAAGTEMSWEELTWASIPQPPSAIESGLPPKGPAWARQFSVAKHALKRLQPALPAAGQQVTPGRGVSVFIMVVSWRRHYVKALQIESKGSVSVFKMLAVLWLRR